MSASYLQHDLLRLNVSELRRRSERFQRQPVLIRHAERRDSAALARLAALDSAAPPDGEVLLAEVGDEVYAALELTSGRIVADPFRPTVELQRLLRTRAGALRPIQ